MNECNVNGDVLSCSSVVRLPLVFLSMKHSLNGERGNGTNGTNWWTGLVLVGT